MADAKQKSARKYDAVLAPSNYPRGKTGPARNLALKAEFSRDFASTHVFWTHVGPDQILITPEPAQARYHAEGSSLVGQDRYEWTDRGDGVQIGMLTPEASVTDEDRDAAELEGRNKVISERQKQVQSRMAELAAKPEPQRTAEENAELAKLRRFSAAMFGEGGPVLPSKGTGDVPSPVVAPVPDSQNQVGPSGGNPPPAAKPAAK